MDVNISQNAQRMVARTYNYAYKLAQPPENENVMELILPTQPRSALQP